MTEKMQAGQVPLLQSCLCSPHMHMCPKKVDQGIAKIWRGWLRACTAPTKACPPRFYPLVCPSPCNTPVSPFF